MRTYIANLARARDRRLRRLLPASAACKLFKNVYTGGEQDAESTRLNRSHWVTLAVIGVVLVFVLFRNANIGMAAFTGAVVLAALRVADHEQAIRKMPWIPILMVSGVSVLVALLEKTGGLDLFTEILAKFATPGTLTGVIAFVTGVISVYSSTSGVVLPAFLPTVPGLIARLGGDPFGVASSMNIGAHLVDMSPLSTTGAMCIAGDQPTRHRSGRPTTSSSPGACR